MEDCCSSKSEEMEAIAATHRRVLWFALAINFSMFVIEFTSSWFAHSSSLLADSLDMLGDALIYGFSLFVVSKSKRWHASVSIAKGGIMAAFGIGAVAQVIYRFLTPTEPVAETMGWIAALALAANLGTAMLLLRHRNDDLNMRSTWICTRNDSISNVAVLITAGLVALTKSKYPDLIVGLGIAILVLKSAYEILTESLAQLKTIELKS